MSTQKRIIYNTRERAISSDNNVLQQFSAYEHDQTLKALYSDRRWPIQFPGLSVPVDALTTPLTADVLGGLMVTVDLAADLLVSPGVALCVVPALAGAEDSKAVLVTDPGVQVTGVLTFVPNPGPGIRLDIVECSVVDTLLSTSSRDIYDTTTGLFAAAVVDKVRAPRMTYRIRQGVAGSGLPALASGWLPLAVVCHQSGTTSFADCDFWDVRPLVSDRVQFGSSQTTPAGVATKFEYPVQGRWRANVATGIKGFAWGQFGGYVAGGQLISSTAFPIADHGNSIVGFDSTYSANRVPGFAMTGNTIAHVVACFPGGLPRWVKYVDSATYGTAGMRVPEGPRGILCITNAQPLCSGYYTAVTLPATCGFTSTAPGVSLLAVCIDNASSKLSGACVGNRVTFGDNLLNALPGIAGATSNQPNWTFSPNAGVSVPANAKAIDVTFQITVASSSTAELTVKTASGDADALFDQHLYLDIDTGVAKVTVRGIPLSCDLPWTADGGGTAAQTYIKLAFGSAASACVAYVVGYSL